MASPDASAAENAVGDLRRERDSARNERDQLRQENQNLRRILGDIDPDYAAAYALLCDIALNGTKADNPKTATAFESQPPRYNPTAYHARNEERRHQRARIDRLNKAIARAIGDPTGPTLVGTITSQVSAQPSRSTASIRHVVVHFSPVRATPRNGGPITDTRRS